MKYWLSVQLTGLSPLARGTLAILINANAPNRFIPAGAGNTTWFCFRAHSRTVYPRWRGEHRRCIAKECLNVGLSPLARGTLFNFADSDPPARFIPAGAGNTLTSLTAGKTAPVYPRWRGEHARPERCRWYSRGLSPLARGTLYHDVRSDRISRFIPAGAGNTPVKFHVMNHNPVYPRWRGEHTRG